MIRKALITISISFFMFCSNILMASSSMTETIKIGLTASLTGKYREAGMQQLQGIQMWRDDINERGSLLGRGVELVVRDDHSRADDTEILYEQLIQKDGVDFLLGPYSSDNTVVAANVAEKYKMPLLAIAASAPSIWENTHNGYVFGTYVQSVKLMENVIELAVDNNIKHVAIIYANTAYTHSIATGARGIAKQHDLDVTFYEMFDKANNSIRVTVERLVDTNPELIIVGAYLENSIEIVKELKLQGVRQKMLVFSGSVDTVEFKNALGDDAEGVISAIQWSQSQHLPGAYDFSFRYKQKYGTNPSYQAAGGYAAGQILEAAVRLSGSLSKDGLRMELQRLKFRSLFGHYRVDSSGRQIGKQAYLMQWQDGKRKLVMPKTVSNNAIRFFSM